MTHRRPLFEQSDRSKGYQKADTHGTRSANSAAHFASVPVNQSSARAKESIPRWMDGGCSQEFHSPFESINEESLEWEQLTQAQRILHAISVLCAAVVISGVLTLLYVNLFASVSPLSRGCGYGLGEPNISPQVVAEAGYSFRTCR